MEQQKSSATVMNFQIHNEKRNDSGSNTCCLWALATIKATFRTNSFVQALKSLFLLFLIIIIYVITFNLKIRIMSCVFWDVLQRQYDLISQLSQIFPFWFLLFIYLFIFYKKLCWLISCLTQIRVLEHFPIVALRVIQCFPSIFKQSQD